LAAPAACSGSDDTPSGVSATLRIITQQIQSALKGKEFTPAKKGQRLVQGDRVRSDTTGFAELNYQDGSWQRIERNATLTVERLTDTAKGQTVKSAVDVGLTWNRVRKLSEPEDAYELDTPVATASVRGTRFSSECPASDRCTFKVLEGKVLITPVDGPPVLLEAPATLEVVRGQVPPTPSVVAPDVLRAEPWIRKNIRADRRKLRSLPRDERGEGGTPDASQLRGATLVGEFAGRRTGVSTNYRPDHPNFVAAATPQDRTYRFTRTCPASGPCVVSVSADGGPARQLAFDGTSYVDREELVTDCVDETTGETVAPGVAKVIAEVRWTPEDAVYRDGDWVVTRLGGRAEYRTELARPDQFGDRCAWPTTDGQPPSQVSEITATRG